jgi:hypothetical protein
MAMTSDTVGTLDEAYQRLHATGPEFDGWLSNHGPMVAEAMARRGQADDVQRWLDFYVRRLEEFPRGAGPIGPQWREALGDPRRVADWTAYFRQEVARQPWREALDTWWPRLLPGLVAAATHGVIRTGHAVQALLTDGDTPEHLAELAHGLAYWAARWQPVPGAEPEPRSEPEPEPAAEPKAAGLTVAAALAALPRIADQTGGIRERLPRLDGLPGWRSAVASAAIPASPEQTRAWLAGLADEATTRYLEYGHGNAIMLVHSATAPTAVLRTLPALRDDLWAPSAAAAWTAAAALTVIYAPADPAPAAELPQAPSGALAAEEVFARAVDHGDEHVIKFADTAVDVHARTGRPAALAAAVRAAELVPSKTALPAWGAGAADSMPGGGRPVSTLNATPITQTAIRSH